MSGASFRLYDELSAWWPLFSAPSEYEAEAAVYGELIKRHVRGDAANVVEFGCGGGNNASHLKKHFTMTLVDISPGMLAVSRELNPECEHVLGDMRTIRLGRTFDAVFVNDAILHMTTEGDLHAAIETAALHCRRGGVVLFSFDYVKETFRPLTSHGGHDGDSRSLRYLEWVHDPDPEDCLVTHDLVYALRGESGELELARDCMEVGIFPRATWLRLLSQVGLEGDFVPGVVEGAEVIVASKP